jgi:hypothetical protein
MTGPPRVILLSGTKISPKLDLGCIKKRASFDVKRPVNSSGAGEMAKWKGTSHPGFRRKKISK